jgi:hypothetical protein
MKRNLIILTISLFCVAAITLIAKSNPALIPPGADPGAIMNYNLQNTRLQQNSPYLFRPVLERDLQSPSVQSEVYSQNESVEGESSAYGMLKTPDGKVYLTGPQQ